MDTIRFGSDLPELSYYEKQDWLLNETRTVEFFPNKYYEVTLISTAEDNNILLTYLSKIDTKLPIAIDLEWEDELCLFQFCYELTVIIIRHPKGEGNKILFNFLKTHFFYGKGINHDLEKLFEKFNYDFKDNIEDIARTRLEPYGHSINFIQMTLQFAGKPTAEFKDVRITKSNWDLPELSMRQVLYAAFDVVAISVAYPNFPPPMEMVHHKKKPRTSKKTIRRAETEFDPEKENRRRQNKVMKQKYETSERILWHNRIVLKQSKAQKTHCYLVSNYKGPLDCVTLKKTIFGSFLKRDIDHIGYVCIGDKKSIIISLFVDHPKLLESKELFIHTIDDEQLKIEKLETVDPEDCTDNDVLFIPPDTKGMQDDDTLSILLYSFGFDIRFTRYPYFIRIQPHRAQQSFIMKTFFPKIFGIKIYTFPDFVTTVRAFMPPHFDELQIKDFFASNVKSSKDITVTLLRRKTEKSEQNALVTFSTVEEAEEAVSSVNYKKVRDFTCYAQRYTDENHIRFLRFFELTVQNNIDYSTNSEDFQIIEDNHITANYEIEVRKRYEKYGKIFQCKYDKNFNVYRVQFIYKKDAIRALKYEKNASFPPTGTMAFVRNLPFTITDEEVLSLVKPYGKVIEFVYREIDEYMRNLVVEVMYTSVEEAHAIKKALHQKQIYGEQLEINVVNTLETEAPIWKMQQRRLYIKLNALNQTNANDSEKNDENKDGEKNEENEKNKENKDDEENKVNEKNEENKDDENKNDKNRDDENKDDNKNDKNRDDENRDGEKNGENEKSEDDDENKDDENKDDEKSDEGEKSGKSEEYDDNKEVFSENKDSELYSTDVDHTYYITEYESSDTENETKVTEMDSFDLLHYLTKFGHVIDIRGDYAMFLTFKEASKAQTSIPGSSTITTNQFVQEIFPNDFSVINVEYLKKPFRQSQPMAVVVDPLPDGLTEEIINHYLDGVEGYFIVFDQISSETQNKSKRVVNSGESVDKSLEHHQNENKSDDLSIESENASVDDNNNNSNNNDGNLNDYSEGEVDDDDSTEDDYSSNQGRVQNQNDIKSISDQHPRAIVYAKSKRAMNIVHSKLHNQTFNGELLNLSKYSWHHVPQRPKNLHPFAELNPPRKQPIIVDPIPLGTKAIDVRKTCEGCGKFDVKIEGSAEKPGLCRAVVQPRNMKAKVNCMLALENAYGKAKRYPRDEVPPVLQENLEEESDYE